MKSKSLILPALFFSCAVSAQNSAEWVKVKNEHYTDTLSMFEMHKSDKTSTYRIEFPQGAHNDWHIHPDAMQTMFIVEGEGVYQEEGKPLQLIRKGDFVISKANVKHWNGASNRSRCTVLTISEISDKPHIEWCGKVDETDMLQSGNPNIDLDSMLVRISEIDVHPEYLDEYMKAALTVGANSVANEPGVVCIYPMVQKRDGSKVRILEIYRDMDAYRHHISTPWFQTYKQSTLHMVKHLDLVDMFPMNPSAMPAIFRKM
ncbi:cupin domain-containing protein [Palleniella muris]|uniref:Cupin domain-containing protein n=1 Tax=Palleniella muris TaxID=3038145 RepID=A0AC61QTC0_9BACT|nr:antibiotic biosynthesis monooxygenase [Palleniella muris]TGX83808.1 cupin domain-containing protein [Palleniella muris]